MSNTFSAWLNAARPRTLFLAIASLLAGGAMALQYKVFDVWILSLTLLTAISLQILSNFANDFGDYSHGVDNENRVGPKRALQSGAISRNNMRNAIILTAVIALFSGISLIAYVFSAKDAVLIIIFSVLGLGAIWAAIKYTAGKNPYGYSGLGDFFVFLFFGLVAVIGSTYLYTQYITLEIVLLGIAFGCFSTGVLNVNNMRDIKNDKASGKYTLPVRIGLKSAKKYHLILLLTAWICLIWFSFLMEGIVAFFLAAPLFFAHVSTIFKNEGKTLDPELKRLSLSTVVVAILILIDVIR